MAGEVQTKAILRPSRDKVKLHSSSGSLLRPTSTDQLLPAHSLSLGMDPLSGCSFSQTFYTSCISNILKSPFRRIFHLPIVTLNFLGLYERDSDSPTNCLPSVSFWNLGIALHSNSYILAACNTNSTIQVTMLNFDYRLKYSLAFLVPDYIC